MGSFVPSTAEERKEMLQTIGLSSMEALYSDVPCEVKLETLDLPDGKAEMTVAAEMEELQIKILYLRQFFAEPAHIITIFRLS